MTTHFLLTSAARTLSLRDIYKGAVFYCQDAVEGLSTMDRAATDASLSSAESLEDTVHRPSD